MPELPEVETTLRGIQPHITSQTITNAVIRHYGLRWPVSPELPARLIGLKIKQLERRGKYLLLYTAKGCLILHLGMSGSLQVLSKDAPPKKHDHIDIVFSNHKILRFTDPRRFGACLWTEADPSLHPLIKDLGVEPLTTAFTGQYLWHLAQKRKTPIKNFIMDSHIVVGVGNIYAAESLFSACIHPNAPSGTISLKKLDLLAKNIKKILEKAIEKGGTTLKNFVDSKGKPGYFKLHLKVYGRGGLPCVKCKTELTQIRLGQRATVYCGKCQK